ncbi:hypothetical protein PAXRUDRAFT_430111 [Paxillus rubicundulus Ve08.2h10]|uniref:Unplaced genomic scaffold scaffold_268, whole genome shotgun sequence n=1 Tax=Paxillus rubicundulus Ve08.2h10 TaxID=930991 RepID=A0A0D0DQI7_9AGAM|nr:hypothetical protein PAXRUDRAFT_430111 [Paxillus rubicundulus Ve08.2h10]
MSYSEPTRSMSHRKPVPKFIPSPPPSPPSSPGAPFRQISLSSVSSNSLVQTDRPPLPEDWRDVIDRVVSRERRSTLPTINTVVDFSTHEGPSSDLDSEAGPLRQSPASMVETSRIYTFAPPSPSESFDGGPVSRPHSPTPWARPGGKRRTQTEYRPPTPPLPRQKSKSGELGCDSPTVPPHTAGNSPPLPSPPLPSPPLPTLPHPSRPLPEIPVQEVLARETRDVKQAASLPKPEPIRPFFDQRKVALPTPPSSLSTHEQPVISHHVGRDASSRREYPSTLTSTVTPTHAYSPSTLCSEKWTENVARSAHTVTIKIEAPNKTASAEHARTKVETLPPILPGKSNPRLLPEALAKGLKRVASLVISIFLCRS